MLFAMNDDGTTPCHTLTQRLLAADPPTERLLVDLPRCRLRLRGNDRGVMSELRSYYREHALASANGDADLEILVLAGPLPELPWTMTEHLDRHGAAKEASVDLADGRVVHKLRCGVVLIMGEDVEAVCGAIDAHFDQVVGFIHRRVLRHWIAAGGAYVHAAGVALGDRGVVLCGPSGAGKSTLSLHLLAHDPELALVANDRAVLVRDAAAPRLLGSPKHPVVNPGTIVHNPALAPLLEPAQHQRYLALDDAELRDLDDDHHAIVHQLFGPGRVRLESGIAAVVFLSWSADCDAPMTVAPVDLRERPDLAALLHQRVGLLHWPLVAGDDEEAQAALVGFLADVPAYELRGQSDFAAATTWATDLLHERGDD
jgi:HprK-related kinase B